MSKNEMSMFSKMVYDALAKEAIQSLVHKDGNKSIPGKLKIGAKEIYIKQVLYNAPATIVFWSDNTKTVSKCQKEDIYNPETGLMICIAKKLGFNGISCWIPENNNYINTYITLSDVRRKIRKDGKK